MTGAGFQRPGATDRGWLGAGTRRQDPAARRHRPMRKAKAKMGRFFLATLCLFLVPMIAGCGHPYKQELMRLYKRYDSEVVQRLYPELENMEGSVRRTTYLHLSSKIEFEFFDDYIASEPELTKESMESLIAARDAVKKAFEHYDGFVSKGKFELSDAESAQGTKYMFDSIDHAAKLFSILEGEIEE